MMRMGPGSRLVRERGSMLIAVAGGALFLAVLGLALFRVSTASLRALDRADDGMAAHARLLDTLERYGEREWLALVPRLRGLGPRQRLLLPPEDPADGSLTVHLGLEPGAPGQPWVLDVEIRWPDRDGRTRTLSFFRLVDPGLAAAGGEAR